MSDGGDHQQWRTHQRKVLLTSEDEDVIDEHELDDYVVAAECYIRGWEGDEDDPVDELPTES